MRLGLYEVIGIGSAVGGKVRGEFLHPAGATGGGACAGVLDLEAVLERPHGRAVHEDDAGDGRW